MATSSPAGAGACLFPSGNLLPTLGEDDSSSGGEGPPSADGSPTRVPRTPYGHKIYLPLVNLSAGAPPSKNDNKSRARRREAYAQNGAEEEAAASSSKDDIQARRSDMLKSMAADAEPLLPKVAASSSLNNDDDIRPRLPEIPLSKDDFGPRVPETPLSGLERLIRCHSIWFLPTATRQEAVNFLHAKEEGVSHRVW